MPKNGLVYVGTYSEPILFGTGQVLQGKGKGIYCFRFDPERGALEPRRRHRRRAQLVLPRASTRSVNSSIASTSSRSSRARRAAPSARSGSTSETGALTFLNTKASHGTDPCHLIVDKTGKNVLIANFASGSVSVLPIKRDGSLKDASCVIQHEGIERRSAAAGRSARPCRRDRPPTTASSSCRSSARDKVMHLRARRGARHAHAEQAPALRQGEARRRSAPARHASERQVRLSHQRAELDDDRLSLRREERHADGAADAADVAGGLPRLLKLRRGADRAVGKIPLRLQPRRRFLGDLRDRHGRAC